MRAQLGDEAADLINHMLDNQLIDVSLSSDAGLNSNAGSGIKDAVLKAVGSAPHLTEVTNRIGTALAAFSLARRENPNASKDELYSYVKKVLDNTHFNYSADNEPLAWKKLPFAHVLLQFKKYQEGMLYLVFNNIATAVSRNPDVTLKERKAARALLGYLAGTHFVAAGAIGVPLSGAVMGVINAAMAALGGDDEPWDSATELHDGIAEVFGDDFATIISKGLPAYLGLDLSQKLGSGDIASFTRFTDDKAQGKEWYKSMLVNSMGPFFGGLAPRAFDGANFLLHGDLWKASEKFAPSIVSSTMKAYRFADEGLTTMYGNVAIPAESFGAHEIFGKALGFTPTVETAYYDEKSKQARISGYYDEQATEITQQYIAARESGEGMPEVMQELRDINAERAEKGGKPIPFSRLQKAFNEKQIYAKERNPAGVRVRKSEAWMMD